MMKFYESGVMPFTPYHFGLSALPGLISRGRLDIVVLTTANVLIDVEVLADSAIAPGWPVHQLWHFHTLLVGGLVGGVLGMALYAMVPTRQICGKLNSFFRFSFRPTLFSMGLSGVLGAWLHVLIDGLYHYDVQPFWPIRENLLIKWVTGGSYSRMFNMKSWIISLGVAGWIIAFIIAATLLIKASYEKKKSLP
jgi:hypothetical protein